MRQDKKTSFNLDKRKNIHRELKQFSYRPGQTLRFPGGSGSHISRKFANEGGKVVGITHWSPLPPRKYSRYSFLLQAEWGEKKTKGTMELKVIKGVRTIRCKNETSAVLLELLREFLLLKFCRL
jgi:hypothetical protein